MYFFDHDPPHLHADYGGAEAQIRIHPVGLLDGGFAGSFLGTRGRVG